MITSWLHGAGVPLDEIDWRGSLTSQDGIPAWEAWESGEEFVFEEPEVSIASLAA
jgi:hypothetical protein